MVAEVEEAAAVDDWKVENFETDSNGTIGKLFPRVERHALPMAGCGTGRINTG